MKMNRAKQSIPSVGHLSSSLLHFPEWGNAVLLRYCIDAKIHHLTRERERESTPLGVGLRRWGTCWAFETSDLGWWLWADGTKREAHAFNLLLMRLLRTKIGCNYIIDKDASTFNNHFLIWSPQDSSHATHILQRAPTWLQSCLPWSSWGHLPRGIYLQGSFAFRVRSPSMLKYASPNPHTPSITNVYFI